MLKLKNKKDYGLGIDYKIKTLKNEKKANKKIYKIYLPVEKSKYKKTQTRGIWQDKNKLYYDYLSIKKYNSLTTKKLDYLKNKHNQICLFYKTNKGQAYLYYSNLKIEVLKICTFKTIKKHDIKSTLKILLAKSGGVTIHNFKNKYVIETWR